MVWLNRLKYFTMAFISFLAIISSYHIMLTFLSHHYHIFSSQLLKIFFGHHIYGVVTSYRICLCATLLYCASRPPQLYSAFASSSIPS